MAELRKNGVVIQEYDTDALKTVDGIADLGIALVAWIVDPHGNALSMPPIRHADPTWPGICRCWRCGHWPRCQ